MYVKDMLTGAVEEVAADPVMHYSGYEPVISADGRHVAYISQSRLNGMLNIYVYDRQTGATELVSAAPGGAPSSFHADRAVDISSDGRRISFYSNDPGLDPAFPGLASDLRLFVRERSQARTRLASLNNQGNPIAGWLAPGPASLSSDGRYVLFEALSPDLPGDNNSAQTYLRELAGSQTKLVSTDRRGFTPADGAILMGASSDLSRIAYLANPGEVIHNHWLIDAGLLSDPGNWTPYWQHVVADVDRDIFADGFQ
jgi:hypothetical protein